MSAMTGLGRCGSISIEAGTKKTLVSGENFDLKPYSSALRGHL